MSLATGIVFSAYALRKSVPTALVVGTFLNGINQFPHLLTHKPLAWSKICLNYLVPFLVSSWSILSVRLSKKAQSSGRNGHLKEKTEEGSEDGGG